MYQANKDALSRIQQGLHYLQSVPLCPVCTTNNAFHHLLANQQLQLAQQLPGGMTQLLRLGQFAVRVLQFAQRHHSLAHRVHQNQIAQQARARRVLLARRQRRRVDRLLAELQQLARALRVGESLLRVTAPRRPHGCALRDVQQRALRQRVDAPLHVFALRGVARLQLAAQRDDALRRQRFRAEQRLREQGVAGEARGGADGRQRVDALLEEALREGGLAARIGEQREVHRGRHRLAVVDFAQRGQRRLHARIDRLAVGRRLLALQEEVDEREEGQAAERLVGVGGEARHPRGERLEWRRRRAATSFCWASEGRRRRWSARASAAKQAGSGWAKTDAKSFESSAARSGVASATPCAQRNSVAAQATAQRSSSVHCSSSAAKGAPKRNASPSGSSGVVSSGTSTDGLRPIAPRRNAYSCAVVAPCSIAAQSSSTRSVLRSASARPKNSGSASSMIGSSAASDDCASFYAIVETGNPHRALEEAHQLLLERHVALLAELVDALEEQLDQSAFASALRCAATEIHLRREVRQALQRLVERRVVEVVGEHHDQRLHQVLLRQHVVAADDLVQQRRQNALQSRDSEQPTVL